MRTHMLKQSHSFRLVRSTVCVYREEIRGDTVTALTMHLSRWDGQTLPQSQTHWHFVGLRQLLPLLAELFGDVGEAYVGASLRLDGVTHVLAEEHVGAQASLGGVRVLLLLQISKTESSRCVHKTLLIASTGPPQVIVIVPGLRCFGKGASWGRDRAGE